ncbi:MAG: hypothetical protein N4A31_03905 [Rickettsiales bacterium]|nr:hypothetical protein [Rickettsiales bacterium]
MVTKAQIDQLKAIEQTIGRNSLDNILIANNIVPAVRIADWHNFLNGQVNAYNFLIPATNLIYQAVDWIVNPGGMITAAFTGFYNAQIPAAIAIPAPLAIPPTPDVEEFLGQGHQEITGSLLLFGDSGS